MPPSSQRAGGRNNLTEHVTPSVYLIASTKVDLVEARVWLDFMGADQYILPDEDKIEMGALLVQLCAKRCYKSFQVGLNPNITKVRDDMTAFIDNILKVGHGCYDGETEVLTEGGWKPWPEVTCSDRLATLNEIGDVEYHTPKRLVSYMHEGKMYRVKGRVDLLVTPDHKMFVCPTTTRHGRKKQWTDYCFMSAKELDDTSAAYLKSKPYRPTLFDSHDYALGQLYGFALGDGHVGKKGIKLRFHLKKSRKVSYLSEVTKALDLSFEIQHENHYAVSVGEHLWLLDLYNDKKEKIMTVDLPSRNSSFLLGVLDGLKNSDGSASGDESFFYDTTSEVLAGQIQIITMMVGWTANISQAPSYKNRLKSFGDKPICRLIVTPRTIKPIINKWSGSQPRSEWIEDWKGMVYCAEVPNNTLYVRRNGKPVWSGNSVLEHVSFSFALENVSRVFTAEMNRHRAGMAISEGSMRYISFESIPYWIPTSIQPDTSDKSEVREAKEETRAIFERAFLQAEENYRELMKVWNYTEAVTKFSQKKRLTSMFRRIIPMGVATGGVWTGNLRALRHIFQMRVSQHAEEEICLVASLMLSRMIESEPIIFKDFYYEAGYWKSKYHKV